MNIVAMRVPISGRLTTRRMSFASGRSSPKTSGFMGQKTFWHAHIAAGKPSDYIISAIPEQYFLRYF